MQKRQALLKAFKKRQVKLQVGHVYYFLPLKIKVGDRTDIQTVVDELLHDIIHTWYRPDNFAQIGILWLILRYPVDDATLTTLQNRLTSVRGLKTLMLKPQGMRSFYRLLVQNFIRDHWVIDADEDEFMRFYAKAHPYQPQFMITLSRAGAGIVMKCHRVSDVHVILNQSGELWRKL